MDNDEAVIALTNMEFRWRPNDPPILVIEALKVRSGERLFIKGASGSGKSTLLSILGGVATPQRGVVQVLNRRLNDMDNAARDHFRADHIGFIFQMFNLLPYLSPLENVLLPCRFSARRRANALRHGTDLATEARRILGSLDLVDEIQLSRPSKELSVGQQQRVAAARALIGSPELLIADEPTSALDWDRRRTFLELLEGECADQGTTLVFVSHDATLEPLFDHTINLASINQAAPREKG